jgi:tetratricopeptide (TPR) repeat protein
VTAKGSASLADVEAALRDGNDANTLRVIRALPTDLRQRFDMQGREAHLLGLMGRHDEEIAILETLIAQDPANVSLYPSLANALKTLGRGDDAVAAAREAIELKPGYGMAWWVLADLKTFRFSDDDVALMQAEIAGTPSLSDRLHLHFALGSAFEQRGDSAAAFAQYAEANALGAQAFPPRAASVTDRTDRSIATFTPGFFADRQGFGHESDAPIFITGLHRSGSTLVEQILGSHPEIEATSELPVLGNLMRSVARDSTLAGNRPLEKLASLDASRAAALGAEYLERAADYRSTGKPRFTDKMPSNWLHIGLIRLILPNATIIDARRHPMAAGFSNFRQNYGAGGAWTYSLESIGRYYADYLRLMRHFDRVLPGKIHHVINERLIDDFEPEVRKLLDHVGVPFDPACLDFHSSGRPVRSASAEQVRRPVNRDGVDQWRAFEQWLGPLKDALGPELENWQE